MAAPASFEDVKQLGADPIGLATRFDFAQAEPNIASRWEKAGCFTPQLDGREPFVVMMPPPNVTGTLHIGHALDNTLPDILVRRARMQGKAALYQPGTDHASIGVHVVMERAWAKEGKTRFDFGREAFLEQAWAWKDRSAGQIESQLRRLGISCDWENARFTMDPAYSAAVNQVFIELYKRGLIYRGQRLVNWDPKMQTAVSDLEVKHKLVHGHLWHVHYAFADGATHAGLRGIDIATTRPETILADGAIAIHPEDPRAAELVGKTVLVPIVQRAIPIVADTMVDPTFGSGMVKITAAHDFNDFAFYQRHKDTVKIPLINLLNADGTLNENCPAAYVGLDRFVARKKIVADLDALGVLIKSEKHDHNVGHAERDDTVLEPYLTWQWYVRGEPLAAKCLAAADRGEIVFVNERDERVYRHWLTNIQDWCVSRQLWWGHRIPAWFKDVPGQSEPEIYVGEKAPEGPGWRQDTDILDTWFSSALWPFVTQGWPVGGERLQAFYPTSVMMSGRDILFFWVVRMMMMGLELTDRVPFGKIYTHGMILDEHGQKMSKSKGNVIDPIALMETFGTDAVRLTMASIASSEDMRLATAKVEQSRNFCTKLWNAARFLRMQDVRFGDEERKAFDLRQVHVPVNRWLVAEIAKTAAQLDKHLDCFEFNQAAGLLYQFSWNVWCDWYLELSKPLINRQFGESAATETKLVAGWAFEQILKMLHPVMPFMTETLWQHHVVHEDAFLMLQRWPDYANWGVDEVSQVQIGRLIELIEGIRQARTENKVPPKALLEARLRAGSTADLQLLRDNLPYLKQMAGIEAVLANDAAVGAGDAVVVAAGLELVLPLLGVIDIAAERTRLRRELDKSQLEVSKIENLLANEQFVARAPAEVLAENKARVSALRENMGKLEAMLRGPYAG